MQLAAYQPIINIEIPSLAATFSSNIAEVVTFDFDYTNFDTAFGWIPILALPENDPVFTDLRLDDGTLINGKLWKEWKEESTDPDFYRSKPFTATLTDEEHEKLEVLLTA